MNDGWPTDQALVFAKLKTLPRPISGLCTYLNSRRRMKGQIKSTHAQMDGTHLKMSPPSRIDCPPEHVQNSQRSKPRETQIAPAAYDDSFFDFESIKIISRRSKRREMPGERTLYNHVGIVCSISATENNPPNGSNIAKCRVG